MYTWDKASSRVLLVCKLLFLSEEMWRIVTLLFFGLVILDAVPQHDVCWRDYVDGHIPEDALFVETGLYIGQMALNGILPGTIYAEKKIVVSECCTGRKQASIGVRILCTGHPENFRWEYVNISDVKTEKSDDLVKGGIENGNILYIGKVFHDGEWKIGKVYPTSHGLRGLRVWTSNGGLHVAPDFQILKYIQNIVYAFDVRSSKK